MCSALLATQALPAVAKPALLETPAPVLVGEFGRYENFRFIETAWDLSKEYGFALPYTDSQAMLWAAAYLKREAKGLVPPGMAELRVCTDLNYGTSNAMAIYTNPKIRTLEAERHLKPKFDPWRGYSLLERFQVH